MTEDRKNIIERLNNVAEDMRTQGELDQQGNYLIVISGLNDTSKKALLEREFTTLPLFNWKGISRICFFLYEARSRNLR